MWLLLGCSVVAMAVAAERLIYYHRATLNVRELLQGVAKLVVEGRFEEALRESRAAPGPVARVIQAALQRPFLPRRDLRDVVQEAGQLEVGRLESHLPVLSTIALTAPLIGMLGTVLGLVDVFVQVSEVTGYATPVQLSRGVYQALVTTAGGLVVGVPAYIFYSFLTSRVRHLMHDMERAGIEMVNLLSDAQEAEREARNDGPAEAASTDEAPAEEPASAPTPSAA